MYVEEKERERLRWKRKDRKRIYFATQFAAVISPFQ